MIEIIPSDTRGAANHGWLDSRFSFSFADYYDANRMGFGPLRVINEDYIEAGTGFGTHPHRDMEIVTYMVEGELEHKDSMGNGSVMRAGEMQRMTAGTGVLHSEMNPSDQKTHLLQIWILPEITGLEPGYEQKMFDRGSKLNRWCLLGSREGNNGSLTVHQDVSILATILEADQSLDYEFADGRIGYLQVVRGELTINGDHISAGDGAQVSSTDKVELKAQDESEVLLFDMT